MYSCNVESTCAFTQHIVHLYAHTTTGRFALVDCTAPEAGIAGTHMYMYMYIHVEEGCVMKLPTCTCTHVYVLLMYKPDV